MKPIFVAKRKRRWWLFALVCVLVLLAALMLLWVPVSAHNSDHGRNVQELLHYESPWGLHSGGYLKWVSPWRDSSDIAGYTIERSA